MVGAPFEAALAGTGPRSHHEGDLQVQQTTSPPDSLSGLIERVTFFNEENGYAVLKIKAKGHRDLVTLVGSVPSVNPGEWATAQGRWVRDREFGLQFKADVLNCTPPTTREGIEKYLGSGMVKGIGPVYAKKLVAKFHESIFDIIENSSARLETVDGIGPKRRHLIKEAWAGQKVIRDIMVFLHSHGVSTSRAVRIYKTYGEGAVEAVRADPYRLARDIHGIGFKSADQIAGKVGIPLDSLLRATAGLNHVLLEATGQGHCALPIEVMKEEAVKLLLVEESIVDEALTRTLAAGDLVLDEIGGESLIYLPPLKRAEELVAGRIKHLASAPVAYPPIDFEKAVDWQIPCAQSAGGPATGARFAGARRHGRPRRRENHAGECDSADSRRQEGPVHPVRSNGAGRQTAVGNHGHGGADDSPPSGSQPRHAKL
jgi:exodeoxyribonuclease V alpha subunit